MDIQKITQNMSETIKKMTQQEKFDLFRAANIIDKEGYYPAQFFSDSTVKADKQAKTAFRRQ